MWEYYYYRRTDMKRDLFLLSTVLVLGLMVVACNNGNMALHLSNTDAKWRTKNIYNSYLDG
jgi:hypothetical protein